MDADNRHLLLQLELEGAARADIHLETDLDKDVDQRAGRKTMLEFKEEIRKRTDGILHEFVFVLHGIVFEFQRAADNEYDVEA